MSRGIQFKAWLAAAVLLAGSAVFGQTSNTAPTQTAPSPPAKGEHPTSHKKKPAAPPPLVLPPLPPGPLQQVPLPQIPETAPKVTYEHGQLTIVAQNATLGEILKQVKKLTGASIDLPANGAPERVVTQIGPGAPRDVLATLLDGSNFNYVLLGTSSDPASISSVLLTPKPGGGETQAAANVQPANQPNVQVAPIPGQPFRQQVVGTPRQPEMNAAEDENTEESDDKDQEAEQEPAAQPERQENNQPGQPNLNQPNAGPRTPEQLLQMMRQGQPPVPPGQQPQPPQQ